MSRPSGCEITVNAVGLCMLADEIETAIGLLLTKQNGMGGCNTQTVRKLPQMCVMLCELNRRRFVNIKNSRAASDTIAISVFRNRKRKYTALK
ncbi:MAG: hypothetical protein ACLR4Z_01445 [Butyricicoccaceae bacterium]